ncbi:MAG: hypothetical protein H0X45_15770 [Planctomycetes bacterium]|nr:hypothetical protein [Planctomycetota bacterium]
MRYRYTGHVRDITATDAFSLEIDPNGRLISSAAVPSSLNVRIADDSPIRDTRGLADARVTCIILARDGGTMLARVHRSDEPALAAV